MTVCVLGSINLDTVASVEELPRAGETITAQKLEQFPGGKGANQAVAAARMQADTLMIGAVGSDDPGNRMYNYLKDSGVDVSGIKIDPDNPTGQAFINVSASGENSIVIVPGANGAPLSGNIADEALAGRTVFLSQLETPLESIRVLFSTDAAREGITILNAAPALTAAAELFELVDILIINETELATYAGLAEPPASGDTITATARPLLRRDGQTVVVTLGAEGAVIVDKDQSHHISGRPAEAVDTTGAGDCFCGVLAAGLGEGCSLSDALSMAIIASSISVERSGAATSMPTRNEVETALTG